MVQPYFEIIKHEDDNWQEFLEQICLYDIFKPVIEYYKDRSTLKCVIRYIAYTYSKDSDKVLLGADWQKNKQQIFEDVMAKPVKGLYEELVLLKNPEVVETIHNWLEHQDGEVWKTLCTLKDLRVEMQLSAVSKILKPSMEVDYTQKFLNAEYADKLKVMIKNLELELIQNDGKLKEAVKEVRVQQNNNTKRSVGSYAVS